jgi:hypothetical protein
VSWDLFPVRPLSFNHKLSKKVEELPPLVANKKGDKHCIKPAVRMRLDGGYDFVSMYPLIRLQIKQQKRPCLWGVICITGSIYTYFKRFFQQKGIVIITLDEGFA